MRILIADDEVEIGRVFKNVLRAKIPNSQVDAVINGAEAVDAFRSGNYDIVLLDVRMPVKDGYLASLEIHDLCKQENLKLPFIIFNSGYEASEEIEKLLVDKSHYVFLQKPVSFSLILETIKSIPE